MSAPTVSAQELDHLITHNDVPVVVDFFAPWCEPCKRLASSVDRLANEAEGKVLVVKLDIDTAPEMTQRFGIRTVPTMGAFHRGDVLSISPGSRTFPDLQEWVTKHILA